MTEVYAASSLSLAMLEQLAQTETGRVSHDHAFVEIAIPDSVSIETVDPSAVAGWDAADRVASRAVGDRCLAERRSCVLLTPSVIVPTEHNIEREECSDVRSREKQDRLVCERLPGLAGVGDRHHGMPEPAQLLDNGQWEVLVS